MLCNQLNFFRKGLKFLEDVDSYIKVDVEQQHIDYQIQELDDNAEEDVDDGGGYDSGDGDDEPSFDYSRNDQGQEVFSMPRSSWEVRHPFSYLRTLLFFPLSAMFSSEFLKDLEVEGKEMMELTSCHFKVSIHLTA